MTGKTPKFLLYFITLIAVGSIGFYVIGDSKWSLIDSLYMTVITLSTVGFKEVHILNEAGRIWTIVVILFGVSGFAYMVSQIGSELMEFNLYRRRKMEKLYRNMKGHYVICGYGRMGAVIAKELDEQNYSFIVVELNPEKIARMENNGYKCIQGDATLDDTLCQAGIKQARGIVVVLDNDQEILFVTMSARTLNPEAFLLSRCANMENADKMKRAGANKVVNPYIAGGHKMSEMLISPYVEDSVSVSTPEQTIDLGIDEIHLSGFERYNNVKIRDCQIREEFNLMILGVISKDGSVALNPDSDTELSTDSTIMVIGRKEDLDRFKHSCEDKDK